MVLIALIACSLSRVFSSLTQFYTVCLMSLLTQGLNDAHKTWRSQNMTFSNMGFTNHDSHKTWHSQNMTVTKTWQSQNMTVAKHDSHKTWQSQNMTVTKHDSHKTWHSQNMTVAKHDSCNSWLWVAKLTCSNKLEHPCYTTFVFISKPMLFQNKNDCIVYKKQTV